jgi:hypothetical protein
VIKKNNFYDRIYDEANSKRLKKNLEYTNKITLTPPIKRERAF